MDGPKEVLGLRNVSSHCSIPEMDDYDLSRLLDKPRLNIERQRSFDERSLSELSIGLSRGGLDNYESTYSPGRSGFDTPASSTRNSFEPHPMVAEAWEALRRSLVYFRGQPVGTIAAYDHASEEVLNYDQVKLLIMLTMKSCSGFADVCWFFRFVSNMIENIIMPTFRQIIRDWKNKH